LERKKSVNTDSVGSSEYRDTQSDEQSRPRTQARPKPQGHAAAPSSDGLFKNMPDAVNDGMKAMHEINVDHNVEKAMRVLKRKLIREGLFKELKLRKNYEKPCEKKKRKSKESLKRARKEEARVRKFMNGMV